MVRSGAVCAAGLSVPAAGPAAGRGAAVGEGRWEGRGEGAGGGDEFRTTGHELIGARVRRMLLEAGAPVGCVDGTVTGWLPAEESDFVSELTRDPAALWHVRFDTDEVGSEDLEEFEVLEAVRTFRSQTSKFLIGQRVWRLFPGIGELLGEVVKAGPGEGGDMIFEVAFDDDLSDLLPWDALHASLARGVNSHAHAADSPELSSTPPPKSPVLLPSGFRRFSAIFPGNSLRHLVKPYDAHYSHSNSAAFAVLSRFMPPPPQLRPAESGQQMAFDAAAAGFVAPALEALKWIPETEEDSMEDVSGNGLQSQTIQDHQERPTVTSCSSIDGLEQNDSVDIISEIVVVGDSGTAVQKYAVARADSFENAPQKTEVINEPQHDSAFLSVNNRSEDMCMIDASSKTSPGDEMHHSEAIVKKEVGSFVVGSAGSKIILVPEDTQKDANSTCQLLSCGHPLSSTALDAELKEEQPSNIGCQIAMPESAQDTITVREQGSAASSTVSMLPNNKSAFDTIQGLNQGVKTSMESEFDVTESESPASKVQGSDSVSLLEADAAPFKLTKSLQASWWSYLKGSESCNSARKPAVEAAGPDCAESLRASWWLSLRSTQELQNTSSGGARSGQEHPVSVSSAAFFRFGESRATGESAGEISSLQEVALAESLSKLHADKTQDDMGYSSERTVEGAADDVARPHKRGRAFSEAGHMKHEHDEPTEVFEKKRRMCVSDGGGVKIELTEIDCSGHHETELSSFVDTGVAVNNSNLLASSGNGSKAQNREENGLASLESCTSFSNARTGLANPNLSGAKEAVQSSGPLAVPEGSTAEGLTAKIGAGPLAEKDANTSAMKSSGIKDSVSEENSALVIDDVVTAAVLPCHSMQAALSDNGGSDESAKELQPFDLKCNISARATGNTNEPICKEAANPNTGLSSTKSYGGGQGVVSEGTVGSGVSRGSVDTEKNEKIACHTPIDNAEVCWEEPFAEADAEAAELLGDELSALWINGALIRQERLPLQLEKDQAIECEDDGTVFQARVSRIDERRSRVLVHFLGWSARHDRWVPLNSRRIRVLPGGTKRDRTDTASAGSSSASGESGAAPQQEERRTRTRTSVIMAQAAGLAAASGASGPAGLSGPEDVCGPEAERRRFGGINSAGMHVPVAANDPMVSLVYSCDGVPAAAVGAILAQLLAAAAARPPAQVQNRGAGRGTVRGSGASGEEEIPVSRECNWSGPELQHGGLLGGVLTPPHLHRQQQRHALPSRPPQESHCYNPAPPLSETRTEQLVNSQISVGGLATTSSAASADRALTPNSASSQLSCGQLNHVGGQSRQAGSGSTVLPLCGPSTTSAPPIADGSAAKSAIVTMATCDSPASVGVNASCRLGPAEARAVGKAGKPARSSKLAAAAMYSVGTAVEVRLDNGEWAPATIIGIKSPAAGNAARLEYRISFDHDDYVDLFLPNPCVKLVFTVGTAVEVRLDNGEWASAVITAVKKSANCDTTRLVYRISFDQPDDFVDLCLPNDSVRRALTGSGNPAILGKKGSAFSQSTAPRQSSTVAKSGAAQLADLAMPATVSSVQNPPNFSAEKICDASRSNTCPGDAEPVQLDAVAGSFVFVGRQQIAGAERMSADCSEPQKMHHLQRKKAFTAASVGGARTTRTRARLATNSAANAGAVQLSVSGGTLEAAGVGNDMDQSIQQALDRKTASNAEERSSSAIVSGEGLDPTPSSKMIPSVTNNSSDCSSVQVLESLGGSTVLETQSPSGILSSSISKKADAELLSSATSLDLPSAAAINAGQEPNGLLSIEAHCKADAETQACCKEEILIAGDEAVSICNSECAVLQTLGSSHSLSAINISSGVVEASAMLSVNTAAEGTALVLEDKQGNPVIDSERTLSVEHAALSAVVDVQTTVTEDHVSLLSPVVATDSVIYYGDKNCAQEPLGSDQSDQSAVEIGGPAPVAPTGTPDQSGVPVTIGASELPNEAPVATSASSGDDVLSPVSAARSELSQPAAENSQDSSTQSLQVASIEQAEQEVTIHADKGQTFSFVASKSNSEIPSMIDLDPSAQETANILTSSSAFLKWRAVEGSIDSDAVSGPEKEIVPISVEAVAAAVCPPVAPLTPDMLAKPSEIPGLEAPHAISESVCDPDCDSHSLESSTAAMQSSKFDNTEGALDSDSLPAQQQTDVLLAKQSLCNPAIAVVIATRPDADTKEPSPSAVDGTSAQTAEPPPVAA